jgi:tetratricopeptide (TPR) repeat protein
MPDLYLMSLMRGEITIKKTPKSKFDVAAEKYIDLHIASLKLEDDNWENKLVSLPMKKAQLKQELLSSLNSADFDVPLARGLKVIISEGAKYLDPEVYSSIKEAFSKMSKRLEELDPLKEDELGSWSFVSDEVLKGIIKVALEKFAEEDYISCSGIFSVLATLESSNDDFWYRLGIAAQQHEDHNLASKAYIEAIKINPEHIGARLFLVECYNKLSQPLEAKEEFEKILSLSKSSELTPEWLFLINNLAIMLKSDMKGV